MRLRGGLAAGFARHAGVTVDTSQQLQQRRVPAAAKCQDLDLADCQA